MSFQIVIRTPQLDMKTLLIFEELLNALDLSLQPIEFLVLVDVVFLPFIQFGLPLALSLQFWVRWYTFLLLAIEKNSQAVPVKFVRVSSCKLLIPAKMVPSLQFGVGSAPLCHPVMADMELLVCDGCIPKAWVRFNWSTGSATHPR